MKKIDISTKKYPNTFALVDDEDYERINRHKWHPQPDRRCVYARRFTRFNGGFIRTPMHREILDAPGHKQVDHLNHNGLDNRKTNLRLCSAAQNGMNRLASRNNTSGYKGVCWHKHMCKWIASITVNGKIKHLGYFFCLVKAAKAYDKAAMRYYGEFAKLNLPLK